MDISTSKFHPFLTMPEDEIYVVSIQKGIAALLNILQEFLRKGIELERICKVAVLLCESGVNKNNLLFKKISERCLVEQKRDGGWVGVEDSMWCVSLLKKFEAYNEAYSKGLSWLEGKRLKDGGWGKTVRDRGRIPITGVLLYLLPDLSSLDSCRWLENEWGREFNSDPKLTYKCAFTLMGLKRNSHQFVYNILDDSVNWLVSQQNEDHGFGPWKGHSVGSDPWCTGIATIGLLQYPNQVPKKTIANSLKWLKEKQLETGLWPHHYVDEGSVWALYALVKGHDFLKGALF